MDDDDRESIDYESDDHSDNTNGIKKKRKRVRASRACDQCRKRRTKCSGETPCASCQGLSIPCIYSPSERRRGPTAFASEIAVIKTRIQTLEAQVAQLMTNGISINGANPSSNQGVIQSPTPSAMGYEVKEERHATTYADAFYLASPQSVRYFGATSSGATHLAPLLPHFNKGVLNWAEVLKSPTNTDPVPSADLTKYLVDVFFTHVHPTFPCVNMKDFQTQLRQQRQSNPFKFLLECIMAYVSINITSLASFGVKDMAAFRTACYNRARLLVVDATGMTHLMMCQGFVFFALSSLLSPEQTNGWLDAGNAMKIALELGLHRNIERHQVRFKYDDATAKSMVTTFFCCLIVDRLMALSTGRPLSLRDRDWDTPLPEDAGNLKTLHQFTKLAIILGEFCSAANAARLALNDRAMELENIKLRLTTWLDGYGSPSTPIEMYLVSLHHSICVLCQRLTTGKFDATTRASSEAVLSLMSKYPPPAREQDYDHVIPLMPYILMVASGSLVFDALNGDLSALVHLRKVEEILSRMARVSSLAERLMAIIGMILMQKGITFTTGIGINPVVSPAANPISATRNHTLPNPHQSPTNIHSMNFMRPPAPHQLQNNAMPNLEPAGTASNLQNYLMTTSPGGGGVHSSSNSYSSIVIQETVEPFYGDSILDDLFLPLYTQQPGSAPTSVARGRNSGNRIDRSS
ncbi:hypothetical protein SeMB42_g02345 [Synchytrium endobioticum]|uniref:Zn(2)-C6 fungal-type domain-containing protein n=1 Tax=Synchytrium endobioticum TaxID=286115 RepID=A0A507DH57_9FUNG|nr:hypothetical protein SeLEV6574_g04321 [Synchytrium endobioticum]TPX50170.1 hypothetical protein SeMB42_g02345 [Synchytrium endobioticum]